MTKFLEDNDISVTKFLQSDAAVAKYLGTASTRFLDTNDITVTKFLDVTVTKFLSSNETAVTKYLEQDNGTTITKFLEGAIAGFLLDDEAVANFLDTTVTKFMETADYNDISVTKFLDSAEDGIAVTRYLDTAEDGIAVTKYLSGAPSYNTYPGNSNVADGAPSNRNVNMTIIQFLEDYIHEHPEHMLHDPVANGDISVTKFLQETANVTQSMNEQGQRMNIIQFLQDNDISVTKFLNYMEQANGTPFSDQNILITEFLSTSTGYLQ